MPSELKGLKKTKKKQQQTAVAVCKHRLQLLLFVVTISRASVIRDVLTDHNSQIVREEGFWCRLSERRRVEKWFLADMFTDAVVVQCAN